MVKVEVIVYDHVFDSYAISKTTTILIQDGGVKGHHGVTYKVQQNPWWFGNHWGASWGWDKVILLLCALPRSFESFKDTMLYGIEGNVTFEEVQVALRTKDWPSPMTWELMKTVKA